MMNWTSAAGSVSGARRRSLFDLGANDLSLSSSGRSGGASVAIPSGAQAGGDHEDDQPSHARSAR
jgi:hypothetical protein